MTKPKVEYNPDPRFTFFPTHRRKLVMDHMGPPQRNRKGDEKRLVLCFRMPLSSQRLDGFPSFLSPSFEAINRENSLVSEAPMADFTLEGMSIEFFPTEASNKRIVLWANKNLYDFNVLREPEGDAFITVLRFKVRTKQTKAALCFWDEWGDRDMWADFVPTADAVKEADSRQMSLIDEPTAMEEVAAHVSIEDDIEPVEDDAEEASGAGEDWPEQPEDAAKAVAEVTPEEVSAGAPGGKGQKTPRGFAPKQWH